jgi:hypothetical protein
MRTIAAFLIIFLLSQCNSQAPEQESGTQNSLQFTSEYTFQITKVADHPVVHFPYDTLSENQFTACTEVKKFDIKFSFNGNHISIQNDSIVGEKSSQTNQYLKYNLGQGLFAGGRFLIWNKQQQIEAEFTIYGSGVPIIRSERGILIKKNQ